jgi:cytochrome c553
MIGRSLLVFTMGLTLASPSAWAEGDAKAGAQKIKALQCISCHGRDGVSKLPEAPNLAGQVQEYLGSSLKAYRDGTRKNDMMSAIAANLKDADIDDLTAYYSGIAISVTPPPKP